MQRLTAKDLLSFSFLSRLKFAPGGKYAAFIVTKSDEKADKYPGDIWLFEDGKARQLTSGGDAHSFIFEDEHTLLFPTSRDASIKERAESGEKLTDFYRIDVRGGEAARAFTVPLAVTSIKKLPSNKYALLYYYAKTDIDFAHADEKTLADYKAAYKRELDYEVLEEIPFWSNGGGFTSRKRSRLAIFDPADSSIVPVTDELTNVQEMQVDSDKVYFVANKFDCKFDLASSICSYDVSTGKTVTLVPQDKYAVDCIFIDSGKVGFFAEDYTGGVKNIDQYGSYYLIEDGEVKRVYKNELGIGGTVASDCRFGGGESALARNGFIYYTTAYRTGTRLIRQSFDGKTEVLIDRQGSIDCFDICGDKLIFVGMTGETLQELYTGFDEKRATSFNTWVNETRTIAPLEECNYINAAGMELDGFVIKPVDYDESKRYPAIFDIHGGPCVAFGRAFFHEMQLWANEGYFVFFTNPRGGDGRGEDFANIRGKYGTIDYDDLMLFTDTVLERYPVIDPARVGVTGGSYGGFMTNWIIGHTNRYAAAASQRSIANWVSKFGVTDIGYYFNAMQIQATPWDNVEKLWWHSPLKYADQAVTPTLFIHSDEDYRCYMAEGFQMFTALRYHGTDARLCLFHGESHELSRSGKPTHRQRRLDEITSWFDKYLKK